MFKKRKRLFLILCPIIILIFSYIGMCIYLSDKTNDIILDSTNRFGVMNPKYEGIISDINYNQLSMTKTNNWVGNRHDRIIAAEIKEKNKINKANTIFLFSKAKVNIETEYWNYNKNGEEIEHGFSYYILTYELKDWKWVITNYESLSP